MFFLKKKNRKTNKLDFSLLRSDMHSHLLPGIDDGSPDIETSIALIKGMKDLGFKKLITTPHVLWDMYQNTNAIILEKLAEVRNKLKEEQIDIEIEAAAEYFLDDHMSEILERKEPLLSFGNKKVLVEFSIASQPFELKKCIFELQIQGYQPVLAHPERYVYLEKNKNFYNELKDAGCLFQMNVLSLSGHYGSNVNNLARHLIKNQFYDLIGTDLHHFIHLNALQNFSSPLLNDLFESEKILNRTL